MYNILDQRLQFLPGVGPERALVLASELDIKNVRDLLLYFPYRYVDRSVVYKISQITNEMPYVQLMGRITNFNEEGVGRTRRLEATFSDETGSVKLVWFAGINYVKKKLVLNKQYLLLGKPALFNLSYSISHPEIEEIGESTNKTDLMGLHPVYRTTEKMKRRALTSKFIEKLIVFVFKQLGTERIADTLSDDIRLRYKLMALHDAIKTIHLPNSMHEVPMAQYRYKFDEFFFLQLNILSAASKIKIKGKGYVFNKVGKKFLEFYNKVLPFNLTNAQKHVMEDIRNDLFSGHQMNRLVQGDVGSGKTIVAIMTMLLCIDNGFQACLMAPTEILAEQHFKSISKMLNQLGIATALLTGMVKGKKRKQLLDDLREGKIDILVGTHALVEETVVFHNLGCAIIDEQHRFGVEQRSKLWKKNLFPPHILVMTATPIPRTLAMTVYGDLEVSVINELPPGRKPITTVHIYEQNMSKISKLIINETSKGHQIYVVYPLIQESEKADLKDLERGYEQICHDFPNLSVGKLHGKMKEVEKNEIMRQFVAGEIQILVSTTVIEVGVDVPNSSVMIIVNAERFGLAQLHQLRGRVGRGAEQSYCVLVTGYKLAENTRKRMEIMVNTNDGFAIAEEDMRLRGPGDIEGTQQSGLFFNLKMANLVKDNKLLEDARIAAMSLLESDPTHSAPQNKATWDNLYRLYGHAVDWSSIS